MPQNINESGKPNPAEEMSLRVFVLLLIDWFKFIKSKFWIIAIFAVVGIACGFLAGKLSKKKYLASTTFIVDEGSKTSAKSGLSLLGLGDASKEEGLFQGDNLKYLYTSRNLLQKVLLSPADTGNKKELLIHRFMSADKSVQKVYASTKNFQGLSFTEADQNNISDLNKNQFIGYCIATLKAKYIKVRDVEKTSGLIAVDITSEDEGFAKLFSDVLVNTVNQYYIHAKTQKAAKEVADLEEQVGRYNKQMNESLYSTAEAVESVPYPNPSREVIMVKPKRIKVDAELNASIYTQLMQQLELARMELQKVTPIIQVVDEPVLPLSLTGRSTLSYIMICAAAGFFLGFGIIVVRRILKDVFAKE